MTTDPTLSVRILAETNMCRSGYRIAFGDRAAVAKTSLTLLRSRVDKQWLWIHSGTRKKKGPTTPLALIAYQAVTFRL